PDGLTDIGSGAFEGCSSLTLSYYGTSGYLGSPSNPKMMLMDVNDSSLTEYTVDEDVRFIGSGAFKKCSRMTSLTIPENVISIGNFLFGDYNPNLALDRVILNGAVRRIGFGAFPHSINSIDISDLASWIDCYIECYYGGRGGTYFFDGYDNSFLWGEYDLYLRGEKVTDLIIPAGVKTIGQFTFDSCRSLTSVTFAPSVRSLGNSAFYGCTNLKDVQFNEGIEMISGGAFFKTGITSAAIPDSVTRIGRCAFALCADLKSITIGSGVQTLGYGAFYGSSFTEITIPENVSAIAEFALVSCDPCTLSVSPDNPYFKCLDGVIYTEDMSTLVAASRTVSGEFVVPYGVTSISYGAFYECDGVTSVRLPSTLTHIGAVAFCCDDLTEVHIDDLASWCNAKIDNYTSPIAQLVFTSSQDVTLFLGDEKLTDVVIPDSVTEFKNNFTGFKLRSIALSENTTSINWYSFSYYDTVDYLYIPASVSSISGTSFADCPCFCAIEVSEDNEYYSSVDGILYNKAKTEIVYVPEKIVSATIPDTIKEIHSEFEYCTLLESIVLPSSLRSMYSEAFRCCESLVNVGINGNCDTYFASDNCIVEKATGKLVLGGAACVIPSDGSVTSIGDYAFSYRTRLTEIEIPECVSLIGSNSFSGCSSLKKLRIPDSVTGISGYAFNGCSSLTDFIIPP
ncbi:MAG: leucine-rich repeat protein, partial [Clostridia bacterium]|nr:leucine-rich repeat protein [Clostridia bacterium]